MQIADKNQSRQGPKYSKVFVKPHFIMIGSLSVVASKSECDRPTPPYKNLVPEIPKLGAERDKETWIWGSLQVLM